jgi:hypothetical protein
MKILQRAANINLMVFNDDNGDSLVYTENANIAKELELSFGRPADYIDGGQEFTWHFFVPLNLGPINIQKYDPLKVIMNSCSKGLPEKADIDSKGVTGTEIVEKGRGRVTISRGVLV